MSTQLEQTWLNLLVDESISRARQLTEGDIGQGAKFQLIDSILAGGITIRGISILDEALEEYLDSQQIVLTQRYPKLFHRLEKVNDLSLLSDYADIDKWRERRNDVGHLVDAVFTWEEAEQCLVSIHRELNGLGLLDCFPQLRVKKVQQRLPPDQTEHSIEIKVTTTVYEDEKVYREYEC